VAPVALALVLAGSACASPEPDRAIGPGGISGRGVTIEVAAGDQTLTARAARLELADGGGEFVLSGDAGIALEGRARLEARADRLRLVPDGPVVEMQGGVRALFSVRDEGSEDAGI